MIEGNPYCKFCKRKYCLNRVEKDIVRDHDLAVEIETIQHLSKLWSLDLKQTNFKYCPLDFYCVDIPLMGDVTTPYSETKESRRKLIYPITEKWSTPGWVIEFFKLSTLIDSASCVGLLSFYVWAFEDGIMVLSATDAAKKPDTMEDYLTQKDGLHLKAENPAMPRSKGKFFNPHRLKSPLDYLPDIKGLVNHYKHRAMVDSTDDLETENY